MVIAWQQPDCNKKEPKAIMIEKKKSSFLKQTTCTHDDGQLGQNM
jgi:hypothetical protein